MALARNEMQTASSMIWTRIPASISNDHKRYAKRVMSDKFVSQKSASVKNQNNLSRYFLHFVYSYKETEENYLFFQCSKNNWSKHRNINYIIHYFCLNILILIAFISSYAKLHSPLLSNSTSDSVAVSVSQYIVI